MTTYTLPVATDPLWSRLERIRDLFDTRLNFSLAAADHAPVAIITGSQAVIDDCCPGYAWVRLARAYPSNTFPTPATTRVGCPELLFAADIELGIARCAASPNNDGTVDVDDLEDEAELVGRDRSILFQTIIADIAPDTIVDPDDTCEIVLGQWEPVPHSGGCMGGRVLFTISYTQCIDSLA